MNYLSICAIMKNEAPYIGDWIKYHLGIGVNHIYLYNNDSTDGSQHRAMMAGGYAVTVYDIEGAAKQKDAYNRCLAINGKDSTWMAFLDIDEYLVYKGKHLYDVLTKYEHCSGVCPHWVLFGSNGHRTRSDAPVAERFTRSELGCNPHVKSIVRCSRTTEYISPHRFEHTCPAVDENFIEIQGPDPVPPNGTADRIYVAHYVTKSYEECMARRRQPRADTGGLRNAEEFFLGHDRNERENLDVLNIWRGL